MAALDLSIPDDQLSGPELFARRAARPSNLQQGRQQVEEPSWHHSDSITVDGRTKSSIRGWLAAASVGPYTLMVLDESEHEAGATTWTKTHELYYNDNSFQSKPIWKKSTWSTTWQHYDPMARDMVRRSSFGSTHTAELKAAEDADFNDVVITCEFMPERDHVQCISMAGSSVGTFGVPPGFDPYGHWLGEAVTKAVNMPSARVRLASTSGEMFWSESKVILTCVESKSGDSKREAWLFKDGQMFKQDRKPTADY